ncbi:MAG: HupE/UreJ family protein [Pseudomonadales bacterium]|nr:HupE/UreJ family protein [Pseudomonadales bacterium]
MTRAITILLGILFFLVQTQCTAHEVRPAFLEINESASGQFTVTWKQPISGDYAVHLVPHLDNGWLESVPDDQYATEGFLIKSWQIRDDSPAPLGNRQVSIEGLADTMTDVFVRIRLRNGIAIDRIVRPESPVLTIAPATGDDDILSFLRLGTEHILSGPDHLAFVLALLLIVRDRLRLLTTITAFTVAHSLTLAGAAFGLIDFSINFLNALIGLSILFLAVEVVHAARGRASFTIERPWIAAFGFGLVHGAAFASGLTSLGLDGPNLIVALLFFNLGVEAGQLVFVAVVLLIALMLSRVRTGWPPAVRLAPGYVIGALATFWTAQSAIAYVTSG